MSDRVDSIIKNALIGELNGLLTRCSEKQVEFFHRIYPGPIESLPIEKLKLAVDLCNRTVIKNEANPDRLNK